MTQEEKAKAYDEAIKKMKSKLKDFKEIIIDRSDIEEMFPELAESKDERIREALLEMAHDTTGDELWINYNVHKEEALAWLEKQGVQKSQRMISAETKEAMYDKPTWSEEDENHVFSLLKRLEGLFRNEFERTRFAIKEDRDWLKSLKQRIGGKL